MAVDQVKRLSELEKAERDALRQQPDRPCERCRENRQRSEYCTAHAPRGSLDYWSGTTSSETIPFVLLSRARPAFLLPT